MSGKKTYWQIETIYKENGEDLQGLVFLMMEALVERDVHLQKAGDKLIFDFPEKYIVSMDTIKSLSNRRFDEEFYMEEYRGKLTDSIYFAGVEKGLLKIKFINSYTTFDDKRTVIQFKELSEKEYFESLAQAVSEREKQRQAMAICATEFKEQTDWLVSVDQIRVQKFKVFEEEKEEENFDIILPEEYSVEYRGSLYSNTFDSLKIGFASESGYDEYYGIINIEDGDNFHDPLLIFSTDSKSKFDYDRYMNGFSPEYIIYQDNNSFVQIKMGYDQEVQKAFIYQVILFKYLHIKDIHIIFSSDVRIENEDFALMKEQFRIMKALDVS